MQDLSTKQHFVGCDVSKIHWTWPCINRKRTTASSNTCRFPTIRRDSSNCSNGSRHGRLRKRGGHSFEHTGAYSIALAEWLHKKKSPSACSIRWTSRTHVPEAGTRPTRWMPNSSPTMPIQCARSSLPQVRSPRISNTSESCVTSAICVSAAAPPICAR